MAIETLAATDQLASQLGNYVLIRSAYEGKELAQNAIVTLKDLKFEFEKSLKKDLTRKDYIISSTYESGLPQQPRPGPCPDFGFQYSIVIDYKHITGVQESVCTWIYILSLRKS